MFHSQKLIKSIIGQTDISGVVMVTQWMAEAFLKQPDLNEEYTPVVCLLFSYVWDIHCLMNGSSSHILKSSFITKMIFCSVTVCGELISTFSIAVPTLDADWLL